MHTDYNHPHTPTNAYNLYKITDHPYTWTHIDHSIKQWQSWDYRVFFCIPISVILRVHISTKRRSFIYLSSIHPTKGQLTTFISCRNDMYNMYHVEICDYSTDYSLWLMMHTVLTSSLIIHIQVGHQVGYIAHSMQVERKWQAILVR